MTAIKRHDLGSEVTYTLPTEHRNIKDAKINFLMESSMSGKLLINSSEVLSDEATGFLSYKFMAGDTISHGKNRAEFQIEYEDGTFISFPRDGFLEVDIQKNIGSDRKAQTEEIAAIRVSLIDEKFEEIKSDNESFKSSTRSLQAQIENRASQIEEKTLVVENEQDLLNKRFDTIVTNAGKDNTENVDARLGADGIVRPNVGALMREMHNQLIEGNQQTAQLKHGLNVAEADQPSTAEFELQGRTMVNLVPYSNLTYSVSSAEGTFTRDGNTWTATRTGATSGHLQLRPNTYFNYTLRNGKYYIAIAMMKVNKFAASSNFPKLSVRRRESIGSTIYHGTSIGVTGVTLASYALFQSTEDVEVFLQAEIINGATAGDSFTLESLGLYELTAAEYQEALALTDTQLAAKYPYVDGVQHVRNPMITKKGKNLLPPFYQWDSMHQNVEIKGAYELEINVTNTSNSHIEITALPNTRYVAGLKQSGEQSLHIQERTGPAGTIIRTVVASGVPSGFREFTTGAQTKVLRINLQNNRGQQKLEISEVMLFIQPSGEAESFQPQNNDRMYTDALLGSSLDGSVRDIIYMKDGKYVVREHFRKDVVIDGSLNWIPSAAYESAHQVRVLNIFPDASDSTGAIHAVLVDKKGTLYESVRGTLTKGYQSIARNDGLFIALDNSETGWTSQPSSSQIKNYFNANPMKLMYLYSTAKETELSFEGSISLHKGKNLLDVDEGIISREVIEPKRYNAANAWWYGINYKGALTSAHSPLKNRARTIIDIQANGKSVYNLFQSTSKGNVASEVANGLDYARIPEEDFDPDATYTVTYMPLDNHFLTTTIDKASVTYQTTMMSAFGKAVERLTDNETQLSIMAKQIIQLYARVQAGGL